MILSRRDYELGLKLAFRSEGLFAWLVSKCSGIQSLDDPVARRLYDFSDLQPGRFRLFGRELLQTIEIPFCHRVHYSNIKPVTPGVEIKVLDRLVNL